MVFIVGKDWVIAIVVAPRAAPIMEAPSSHAHKGPYLPHQSPGHPRFSSKSANWKESAVLSVVHTDVLAARLSLRLALMTFFHIFIHWTKA